MSITARVVKHGSGHSVELVPTGDAWQSGQMPSGGYGTHALVTAPELDRLIAALCKARDDCRRASRPRAKFGTYRTRP